MKLFVSLTLFLLSLSANSFDARSSWEEIFQSGTAIFYFNENIGGIALENACMTDAEIRTIQPMRFCPKLVPVLRGENKDKFISWECERWVVGPFHYPRSTYKDICIEMDYQQMICRKFAKVIATVPQTIKVGISRQRSGLTGNPDIFKDYTFPWCSLN